jgi:NitT/TauT family transport system substrate-binding protein
MQSIRYALIALGLALVFGPGAASADPVKIRTSYVVPVSNWAAWLATKPDLMTHQGKSYVTETTRFQGTPPMITALASGDIEIGDLGFSSLAFAIQNAGISDLRIISDDFQDGVPGNYSDEFFVLNDSGIKTVADLKGKVIGTNAGGSAIDIAMRAMLRKNHLDDKKDATFVEAAFPNMKSMLAEHKIDLLPGVLPFSLDPELRAMAHPLFVQKDAMGQTQMIVWTARASFIQKNRAAMVDFMEDALKVLRWYSDPNNHADAIKLLSDMSKIPPERLDSWLFVKGKDYYRSPNGLPNIQALQANVDEQKQLGFLNTDIDVGKYTDLSLVKEAAARIK